MLQAARALQLCGRPLGLGLAPRWLSSSPVAIKIKVGRQEAEGGATGQRAGAQQKQLFPAAELHPRRWEAAADRLMASIAAAGCHCRRSLRSGAGGRPRSGLPRLDAWHPHSALALPPAEPRRSAGCHAPAQQCIHALQGEEMLGEPLDVDKAFPQ